MGHGGQLGLAGETVPWGPGRQKPVLRQGQGHAAPRVSITSFGLCFLMAVPGPSVPPSPAPRICHGLPLSCGPPRALWGSVRGRLCLSLTSSQLAL